MARVPSVSRQLVVSIAVPLVISFALTALVLDRIFRSSANQATHDRLDEQVIALVAAAGLNQEGRMDVRQQDSESRLSSPNSGHYALVRNQRGRELWRSPSLSGHRVNFGPLLASGRSVYFETQTEDGATVAIFSRGLQWDYSPGNSANLVFSVGEDLTDQLTRLRRFHSGRPVAGGIGCIVAAGVAPGAPARAGDRRGGEWSAHATGRGTAA